jgi:hypothetical protein
MGKKISSILNMKKVDFDLFIKNGDIQLREARLIPILKPGDEMALTSVFLSSIRLIKEFRKMILSTAKISSNGNIHVYTEIIFPENQDSRIDGLLIVERGGKITDAAIFEMKNGNNDLDQAQIDKYIHLSKIFGIPNLITISNQFVSDPSQSPLIIRNQKHTALFHFSWSYLLTLAHILLFDNDTNIEDKDQVEIMQEVVHYLESPKSGVMGFNQMKPGWKEVVEKINSGTSLKVSDTNVDETIQSWQQEEKDLALILSRKLGVIVNSGESKYKGKLKARLDADKKKLVIENILTSNLRVKDAISPIEISGFFKKRSVEMSVNLGAPQDKTVRGQLSWLIRQFQNCEKKSESLYSKINSDIFVELSYKRRSKSDRFPAASLDSNYQEIKDKEIKEFKIILLKDFGKGFSSRTKFVETIELMLVEFYRGIIQYLSKWEKPAPKIKETPTLIDKSISDKEGFLESDKASLV